MFRISLITLAVAATCSTNAVAAVSAEEAKQLGTTLTPVGAEKAGNKEGTIPEWTGGLTTPPAGFQKGSGKRPNPFANEKPRLTITSANVAEHASKLSAGTVELLKRNAELPARRLSDAAYRDAAEAPARQRPEERDAAPRSTTMASVSKAHWLAFRSRFRRTVTR